MTEPTPETHDQHVMSQLPHNDVNAEEHIGEELIDPWVDSEQTDWPNAEDIVLPKEED